MRLLLALFVCIILAISVRAQEASIAELDSAFAAGDYLRVEVIALRLLQEENLLTEDEKIRIHLTAGYALILQEREKDARRHFSSALDVNPNLELDPVEVSPKFRAVFDDVKKERAAKKEPDVVEETLQAAAIGLLRPSPTSHALSLLLPGVGHLREGMQLRGAMWIGLTAASVGVLVWRISESSDSRDAYLSATAADEIERRFDDYNRDFGLAWAAGIATGVVYVASQVDLAFAKRSELRLGTIGAADMSAGLAYSW